MMENDLNHVKKGMMNHDRKGVRRARVELIQMGEPLFLCHQVRAAEGIGQKKHMAQKAPVSPEPRLAIEQTTTQMTYRKRSRDPEGFFLLPDVA